MQRFIFQMCLTLALIFAGIGSTGTALADKQGRDNNKKGQNHKQEATSKQHKDSKGSDHGGSYKQNEHGSAQKNGYFSQQKQVYIHEYYADQFRKGHCPPGLAKKGNRCIPRGHARNWSKGRPLPREVIFYTLPPRILVQLGPPPPQHRFVRVAQDILLISIGTGMVVDAFEDIGRQLD